MTKDLFSRRSLTLSGTLAVLLVGLAASPALADPSSVDTSACTAPQMYQPFLSARDSNWYRQVPVTDAGWTLTGGAQLQTVTLPDGEQTTVIDIPTGGQAVSPTICVDSTYPKARTMVRNVARGDDVTFGVSYAGTKSWDTPQNTGHVHGNKSDWTLSAPVDLHPGNRPGWQLVRFTFTGGGHISPQGQGSEFQIYDFYVDPRMRS